MMHRNALLAALLAGVVPSGAGTAICYHLSAGGDVSIAVYDAKGVLVRELLRAAPLGAGDHALPWDGRGRDDRPVPAGDYTWKLLETQGLHAEFLLSVGSNYPVGTDLSSSGGPGTHLAPYATAVDATGVYVAALQTENVESGLIKLDPEGKVRLWSQKLPADERGDPVAWEGARSLAAENGELFLLGHRFPQRVHVSDAKTGRPRRALEVDWEPPRPDQRDTDVHDGATDMAVGGGKIVVAYRSRDAVCWFDAQTGAYLATAQVHAPAGVAVDRHGTVFASSDDRVVRLTRERPRPITLRAKLIDPGVLSVDPASGDLMIFEGGERQQIVRLSARGDVVRRYGRAGGRQEGLYVPADFRDVTDLTSDGAGGLVIAEPYTAPRRVAHLDSNGLVLKEWYGGQPWDTGAAFEPGRPDAMWVASAVGSDGSRWIMRVLIDYPTRSWRVHSCYRYVSPLNPLTHASENESHFFHIYRHADTNYLATEDYPCIWKIDEARWALLPATSFTAGFQWNDANGDGLVQEPEKTPFPTRDRRTFQVPHLAENFDSFFVSSASEPCRIRRLPVTAWTAAGAPVYGGDPDGEVYADCPRRFVSNGYNDPRWSVFLHFEPGAGKLFGVFNAGTTDWCASRDSFAEAWYHSGPSSWQVGEQAPVPSVPPNAWVAPPRGLIYRNLRGIAGVTHGCLVALDVDGGWRTEPAQTYVWDPDGLFVGGLFDHPKLEGTPQFMYHLGGELAHGTLYTGPDGEVIFAGNWESDMRLYRISGWETATAPWVRMSGKVTRP